MRDADLSGFSPEELLDRAYNSDNDDEILELVKRALELEPDNPEALLFLSDLTEDVDERLDILLNTINNVHAALEDLNVPHEFYSEHDLGVVYLALLQRAAFTLFEAGDDERAMQFIEELLSYDIDDDGAVKSLYYRILIERCEWEKIIYETEQDENHELGWAYARVAAAFMTKNIKQAEKFFWEALMMSPNAPFYMLGYFTEPIDENSSEDLNDFNFAILYTDVWSISRDLLNWFSRNVILFGLLTGRFKNFSAVNALYGANANNEDQSAEMLEILKSLGGRADYKKLKTFMKLANINPKNDVEVVEFIVSRIND